MDAHQRQFQQQVWNFFQEHRRNFPWRQTTNLYQILVAEVMLQQTQTSRVVPFFDRFLQTLPTVESLAAVDTETLLKLWQGLGYNRRALFLRSTAQTIQSSFGRVIPANLAQLQTLPGIGPNTAGAILAYAFNQPVIFLETNIRKAFIYHFFPNQPKVSDQEIRPLVAATMDKKNPREWYWALVDYGNWLGRTKTVTNNRSRHYIKQSTFEGSARQLRSHLLRLILEQPRYQNDMAADTSRSASELATALGELVAEGFVTNNQGLYTIARSGIVEV